MNPSRNCFLQLAWQVVRVEWAVFYFMALLYAAPHGAPINSKCTNWRVYDDSDMTCCPLGSVFPLLLEIVAYIRQIGVHNIIRGTKYWPENVEALLQYVVQTHWSASPGYFWYDYEGDFPSAIQEHPYGQDDEKVYTHRVITLISVASGNIMNFPRPADYHPLGIGFSSRFIGGSSPPSGFSHNGSCSSTRCCSVHTSSCCWYSCSWGFHYTLYWIPVSPSSG